MRTKAGRPSLYNADEHPKLMRQLIGEAKTLWEISQVFGIAWATLTEWREKHPELAAAIKLGKKDAVKRVERALFERATGYTHASEKIVVVSGGKDQGSSIERVPIVEHYPPDPVALKFYLTNREPKDWAEKSTVVISEDRATRLAKARARKQVSANPPTRTLET
jgi:hypothetical protein